MTRSFFITTAIDYVNGEPHLGHLYEKVLTDVFARYQRSLGHNVLLITGVDEHGQKVQQSAQKCGIGSQDFCDKMAEKFRQMQDNFHVSYDRWVRTTNPQHKKVVQHYLQKLKDKGEIYFEEHEGYYSTRAEQFVTEKDRVDGEWPEIFGKVIATKEPNYFFRLSSYQDWLRTYLEEHEDLIFPSFRRNEVLAALEKPLNDLCISRPKSRLEWGIPLPFDPEYVTYVWFDALLNYVSYAENPDGSTHWPATAHVIGKDILVPAHAVYWPIMLKALDLPLFERLIVHGWWMDRGAKMSKSTGHVVDPHPYLETFGADALRYFLIREMVPGQDADFSDDKLIQRYTADLGNDLGNLIQRSLSMLHRYRKGEIPSYEETWLTEQEKDLRSNQVLENYQQAMESFQTKQALEIIWKFIQQANQYVERCAPWKLAKDPTQTNRLDLVLAHLVETTRRLSILIEPVLPLSAAKIRTQLGLPSHSPPLSEAAFGTSLAGQKIETPQPLFPRLEPREPSP